MNNYLLKINGEIFPMKWIVFPSWDVSDEPIIKADYYDTEYNRHIIKAPKNKIEISFVIRKLYEEEFRQAIAYFNDEMEIEYYNLRKGIYEKGIFTYKNRLTPVLDGLSNNKWLCKELTIILVKNKDVEVSQENIEGGE